MDKVWLGHSKRIPITAFVATHKMSVQEHVSSDSENLAEQAGNEEEEDEEMSLPPCQFCQEQASYDPREGKIRATILWIFDSSMRRESESCSCETSTTEGARALIAPSRCFLPISCPSLPGKASIAELFWTLYLTL